MIAQRTADNSQDYKINTTLSVIIPLLDEEESIPILYTKLKQALKKIELPHEIIFVDDGSIDNSFQYISNIIKEDSGVKAIKFRTNFGKAAALSAGFKSATGNIIITMDADIQDEPEEIPAFLKKINEGYDLVSGWKFNRQDPFSKRFPSKVFNKVISIVSGVNIHDFNCGFKIYRREVIEDIPLYGELHRYIPILAYRRGFRITEIPVKHNPRLYGRSKYGIERFTRAFLDFLTVILLTRYTRKPLHLFGSMGLISTAIGAIIDGYLSILWIKGYGIGHRPLLILGVLLMIIGIQFVSIGLLGELIIHTDDSKKKDYSIEKKIGL